MEQTARRSVLHIIKLTLTGTGVNENIINFRPPRDRAWLVKFATGFHNDTVSRTIGWALKEENKDNVYPEPAASKAASVRHDLINLGEVPIELRYNHYAFLITSDGLATGQVLTLIASVEEYDAPNS